MKRIGLIIALLLGLATQARADNLGCFNASEVVHIWAQFASASGVATSPTSPSAKIFSPSDTTTASFTPTLAEIDAGGSPGLTRGSFTLGASPASGIWTVQYKGTVGGNVQTVIDVFQVPCPKMAIRVGGIPGGASPPDGTLSSISTTTLTLSTDMISAANQFAYQARIEVYHPTSYLQKGISCIVASTTAAGPADTVTTAEDISATIATSDAFYLIPDPTCRNLRGTTAGNTFDVASTGEGGLDFANIKQAAGATTLSNITVPTVTNLTNAPTAGDLTATMKTSVENAVWDATASSHNTALTTGNKLNSAASAGDPWSTSLPGAYGAGTAGFILGNRLDTTISSRSAPATAQTIDFATTLPGSPTANTVGEALKFASLRLDAAISSRLASGNVTVGGYAAGQDPAALVLNATASSYNTALTIGNKINAAASAGDPWSTALPGAYGAGTAGFILGNRLDVAASSLATTAQLNTKIPSNLSFTGGNLNANTVSVEGVSLSGKVGDNFNLFFQNGGADTTKIVEQVGTGSGGGGGGIDMAELVPSSPISGSVGQALRFVLDRLDVGVSTRASQQNFDTKIPAVLTFTGLYPNVHIKGMDPNTITPEVLDEPVATIITAAAGCNNGVNSAAIFSTNLTQAPANFFRSVHLVTFTSGALKHSSAQITGYTFTGSAGCLTVTPPFPAAPSIGDRLVIINK